MSPKRKLRESQKLGDSHKEVEHKQTTPRLMSVLNAGKMLDAVEAAENLLNIVAYHNDLQHLLVFYYIFNNKRYYFGDSLINSL